MSIVLRKYQQYCITDVRSALRQWRSVLLQAPTGAGKTAMASYMLGNVAKKNNRGFFICHRRELVDQTAQTFDKVGIEYGYIASGYPSNHYQPIQICSIDTLKNRLATVPAPHFCVWDEAHHLGAAGWTRVHEFYARSYHVGLSATPQRLDGKGLNDRFDHLVRGPSVRWLIDEGHLANYKLYSVPGVDLSGVHIRMGDYVKSETEQVMDKSTITGNIISHWRKYAHDKLTIGFAVSVRHSQHIVEQFRAAGIPAVHLDANTHKTERRNILREFALGNIRVVFNVGLFAEGFDIAANSGMDVTVGAVIDAAPTQSLGMWLQRCGRALRPQEQPAVILDHAGNALRHGLPCQDREWTLEGREKGKRGSGSETGVPIKQCTECFAVHEPAPQCPQCGHVYEVQSRKVEEVEGELQEVDPNVVRLQARREQGKASTLEALLAIEKQRGYKPGWAKHVFKARRRKRA